MVCIKERHEWPEGRSWDQDLSLGWETESRAGWGEDVEYWGGGEDKDVCGERNQMSWKIHSISYKIPLIHSSAIYPFLSNLRGQICLFVCFCGDGTWGFTYARQVLYHRATPPTAGWIWEVYVQEAGQEWGLSLGLHDIWVSPVCTHLSTLNPMRAGTSSILFSVSNAVPSTQVSIWWMSEQVW